MKDTEETKIKGTRYWTFLKYLLIVNLLYPLYILINGGTSYRSIIVMPVLILIALWIPRPSGWIFLIGSSALSCLNHLKGAFIAYKYTSPIYLLTYSFFFMRQNEAYAIVMRTYFFIAAILFGFTAYYLFARKELFVTRKRKLSVWQIVIVAILILIMPILPYLERWIDPTWAHRDMQIYMNTD